MVSDATEAHDEYLNERLGELVTLLRHVAQGLIKFLISANAGGVLGVVAISNTSIAVTGPSKEASIISFGAGLVLASLALLLFYLKIYKAEKSWRANLKKWDSGKINWQELNLSDDKIVDRDFIENFLMLASFALFVIGVVSMGLGVI